MIKNIGKYSREHVDKVEFFDEVDFNQSNLSFRATIFEKGYTGLPTEFGMVSSDKKPANRWLRIEQNMRIQNTLSDTVPVGNFFGIWFVFSWFGAMRYWNRQRCAKYLQVGLCSDQYARNVPLRCEVRLLFNSILNRLVFIGELHSENCMSRQHEHG